MSGNFKAAQNANPMMFFRAARLVFSFCCACLPPACLPNGSRRYRRVPAIGYFLIFIGLPCWVGAQVGIPRSNLQSKVIDALTPVQLLDSQTVYLLENQVFDAQNGNPIDATCWKIQNNQLLLDTGLLKQQYPDCRQIKLQYRRLPVNLGAPITRLDSTAMRKASRSGDIAFDYTPYEPDLKPWESAGLTTGGAYTRGLSFGNSQNLVFNSNLNLQLNGKLGNDLEIAGTLSDNSIPLQPDGTTRQLQEFDRIFIQIKRKSTVLSAGDFDLLRPAGSYFSNYFKRLQGGMVTYQGSVQGLTQFSEQFTTRKNAWNASDSIRLQFAAAISKGKFSRQLIQGQEGNQGPYRLQGAEGERFIIVLAGTEKVFIDGQLLRRGLADDYIIDYNLGEITFTPRRLITKDIRITVEFEYAVQSFLRSTITAGAFWTHKQSKVYFNLYSEQDGRSSSSAQDLSSAARLRLSEVGDNLRNAFSSGVDTLEGFSTDRVLYTYIDTVACGNLIRILRYNTNADSARYAARFSEVPAGQGNYVQVLTAANGRVFRWVAPDPITCQPTGNYEPVVRLIAPEQRQLYTLGTLLQPVKGIALQAELALSSRDYNRFSALDDANNQGLAGYLSYKQTVLKTPGKQGWLASVQGNYEYTARTFQALNPYRAAEFVRDWNTNTAQDTAAEQLAKGGLNIQKSDWGNLRYEFGTFNRKGAYEGQRHFAQMRLQQKGFEWMAEINLLQTIGRLESSRFSRPKLEISKSFFSGKDKTPLVKIGVYAERERNERFLNGRDTLSLTSFWYDLYRVYFQTPETNKAWQLNGAISQRNDYFPVDQYFRQNTAAREGNLNGRWNGIPKDPRTQPTQNLSWTITYRNLRILAPELTTLKAQETYLGRIDYTISAFKNAFSLTTGYEIGAGQSPKIAFNYIKVNPGEGQYTWVDRNRDSLLQIDEMETAVFLDQANYVRVAVTTTDYIRTNNLAFNQNLRLEPRLIWGSKKGWKKTLSKFSTQSTLQINRRTIASAQAVQAWNPFQGNIVDTSLVTLSSVVRNVLFLNRANPAWDASITQSNQGNQVVLTTGFEQRRNSELILHGRINIGTKWSIESDLSSGVKKSDNQTFNNRDFNIVYQAAGPKISWLPSRSFRMAFSAQYRDSKNSGEGGEKALQNQWNAELAWNPQSKANPQGFQGANSLRLKGAYTDIRYTGQSNTAIAFTMLDGLQNGKNFLWSLSVDRQLSKSMQLSISYDGRKTGENRIVHVGRAQVRAVF